MGSERFRGVFGVFVGSIPEILGDFGKFLEGFAVNIFCISKIVLQLPTLLKVNQ